MKPKFTPEARADLAAILTWIAADNPTAAREVVTRIRQTALLLSQFPKVGRKGRVLDTREFAVPGLPYTIVFREVGNELIVLTILHQSRRYP